jgi:23S rRNA pseudouridine2457 synthase
VNSEFKYYIIYKPYGIHTKFSSENNERSLKDLNYPFERDIYPAGRLDKDSEGLLLLSNDTKFKHKLMDPKFNHSKTYWAQVDGLIDNESLKRLENGKLQINTKNKIHTCKPAKVRLLKDKETSILPDRDPPVRFRKNIPTSWIEITISEGKNRQVRKMTAKVGFPTLRLIRMKIDQISLGNLKPGEVIELKEEEVRNLSGL